MNTTIFTAGTSFGEYILERGFNYNMDPNQQEQDPEQVEADPLVSIKSFLLFEKIKELKEFLENTALRKEIRDSHTELNQYLTLLNVLIQFFNSFEYDMMLQLVEKLTGEIEKIIPSKKQGAKQKNE